MVTLPSGRSLYYWNVSGSRSAGFQFHGGRIYGGMLFQNIIQAIAADLLHEALHNLMEFNPIMVVHDEIVFETSAENAPKIKEIMEKPPWWATGLPIAAELGHGSRYSK
jgi:DNA polymerase